MQLRAFLPVLVLFSFDLCLGASRAPGDAPVVDLGYAKYKGSTNRHGVREYLGMRYAAPPLGDLRYRAPQDPPHSKGVTQATEFGPTCFPVDSPIDNNVPSFGVPFNELQPSAAAEDCLFLDVFTPKSATPKSKKPVMVYISGGGYSQISNYGFNGTALINAADNDLVTVFFSYRVGHFGFLTSEEVRKDGALNAGLLDQRKALQWVQDHIAAFGGDPNHVVLNGNSAGGGSIATQMTAYGGKPTDLFIGAIIESVFLPRRPSVSELESQYRTYLNSTGCDGLVCLRKTNTSILQKHNVAQPPYVGREKPPLYPFTPVIDGNLVREQLYTSFAKGKYVDIPVMIGDTSDEGTIFVPQAKSVKEVDGFFQDNYPKLTANNIKNISKLYPYSPQKQYRGVSKYFSAVADAYGEATFTCPGNFIAETIHNNTPNKIWNYRYNVLDPNNTRHGVGVPHTFETVAVFGPYGANAPEDASSYLVFNENIIPTVMAYWQSFMRTLDPNTMRRKGTPKWNVLGDSRRLLLQTNQTKMEGIPAAQAMRCKFWNNIGASIEQ